jgi:hypothetical protein
MCASSLQRDLTWVSRAHFLLLFPLVPELHVGVRRRYFHALCRAALGPQGLEMCVEYRQFDD